MKERLSPEEWLEKAELERQKAARGKLKIYLGAAPGVGKTYAMVQDAIAKHSQGLDVVIGIAESHGRQEIEHLLKKLEALPRKKLCYHDHAFFEFDLKSAIKRDPALILIDEMAHTNVPVPDLLNTKRWQDIKEVLDHGIDVYTTLNIQHIESLNHIVSQIIQAPVRETVPDTVLELADTIELIDLPPEDLLKRLEEGKVYVPEQAKIAKTHFFQSGNLTALRELALRVTAERVEAQVILHRQREGIKRIWPTAEKILVCIEPGIDTFNLIRSAKRMADQLHAQWIAACINTSAFNTSEEEQNHAIENLHFAEKLGAQTRILSGTNVVEEIMTFAREQNVTQIIVWKKIHTRFQLKELFFSSLADKLVRHSSEIDVHIVTPSLTDHVNKKSSSPSAIKKKYPWHIYLSSCGIVALATLINLLLYRFLGEKGSLIMIYLLFIMLIAWFGHMSSSIMASLLSVLAYDYFFIPPRFSLTVTHIQDAFTLAMMLTMTLMISYFTIRLYQQAKNARSAERYAATLHALNQQLARVRGEKNLLQISASYIGEALNCEVWILLPSNKRLTVRVAYKTNDPLNTKAKSIAEWVYQTGQAAGLGTDTIPASNSYYTPLATAHNILGVLRLTPLQKEMWTLEKSYLLESYANQIAIALEAG